MKEFAVMRKWGLAEYRLLKQGLNFIIIKQPLHSLVWIYSVLTQQVHRSLSDVCGDSYELEAEGPQASHIIFCND